MAHKGWLAGNDEATYPWPWEGAVNSWQSPPPWSAPASGARRCHDGSSWAWRTWPASWWSKSSFSDGGGCNGYGGKIGEGARKGAVIAAHAEDTDGAFDGPEDFKNGMPWPYANGNAKACGGIASPPQCSGSSPDRDVATRELINCTTRGFDSECPFLCPGPENRTNACMLGPTSSMVALAYDRGVHVDCLPMSCEELASMRRELGGKGGTRVVQPETIRRQQEAFKLFRAAGGGTQSSRNLSRSILPTKDSERGGRGSSAAASAQEVWGSASSNQSGGAVGSGGNTQFMSREDLTRQRHEMRENCRQRQRDQANKRADMDRECPLFLSLRMRRLLEFALALPPAELDTDDRNDVLHKNSLRLTDDTARAICDLTCCHRMPPSFVRYFLNMSPPLRTTVPASEMYHRLLQKMQSELRDDAPSGVDWSTLPDGRLHALVPAKLALQVDDLLGYRAGKRPRGGGYGVSTVQNEEVVHQLRKGEDRGPPRTWFGTEGDFEEESIKIRKAIPVSLPISEHRQDICAKIRDNQVVLIQGETGCGKTTQVPQYLLEMAMQIKSEHRRAVRIVVTQPRRIAAITVAKRVADELGEVVGEGVVGYKIRGTTCAGPRCKLLFCTTGVILRRLANEGKKWMFSPKTVTHLLVDEVHERGVDTDFMLTFLKEVQSKRPNLRVVLMSATMDTECFLKYFSSTTAAGTRDGKADVVETRPPMVVCPAFCHPVAEVYLEAINQHLGKGGPAQARSPDDLRRGDGSGEFTENDGIDYELIVNVLEEIERAPDGAWSFAPQHPKKPQNPPKGAVLIFLPGLGEISQLMSTIQEQSSMASSWWVVPLHASLPPEEQQTCFSTVLPAGCTRKIICSTNVAETSVTVPDVTTVIDTCRERKNHVDRYSNTPTLREQWCAKDSLKQRRGRAGRVQPGVCFRLLPENYMDRLDAVTPPEMQRVPLENVYLQVCASGIEDRPGFLAKTPDPPDETAVLFAEVALSDLGALDESETDGMTALGRHLAALPCHPRLGKILVLGCLLKVPGSALSICAAMSVRNPLMTTQDKGKREAWQDQRLRLVDRIGTRSDHCVWAHIMQEWRFGDMKQRDFCRQYGLSFERMCSAMFERKHLCESLVQVGLLPSRFLWNEWFDQESMPDWNIVRAVVVGGLYPNVIHVERGVPRFNSNSPADKNKYMRYSVLQRHHSREDSMAYPKSLNLHPNSMCFGQDQYHCPWLAFYTIQHTSKLYAYDVSEVNPYALLIFGAMPVYLDHTQHFEIGGWARFSCPNGGGILKLIEASRKAVQAVLEKKLENIHYDLGSSRELAAVIELLSTNGLGYRPPPAESEEGRLRKVYDDDEFDEWENETSYMIKKDKQHEDQMKAAWSSAKTWQSLG